MSSPPERPVAIALRIADEDVGHAGMIAAGEGEFKLPTGCGRSSRRRLRPRSPRRLGIKIEAYHALQDECRLGVVHMEKGNPHAPNAAARRRRARRRCRRRRGLTPISRLILGYGDFSRFSAATIPGKGAPRSSPGGVVSI